MKKKTNIFREDLIRKCDDFLAGKINAEGLQLFASKLLVNENFDQTDEILDNIIYQWEMEEMSFPINEVNIKLWKEYLTTGIDKLAEFNNWNVHIDKQKELCVKYNSDWNPINKKLMIGSSNNLDSDPINGLRHPKEGNATGWYIWTGKYSESEDFFKTICAEHLLQIRPQLIKYFGLNTGFRFLIDKDDYEDVWYDPDLKNI